MPPPRRTPVVWLPELDHATAPHESGRQAVCPQTRLPHDDCTFRDPRAEAVTDRAPLSDSR